jgi:hypothetical protein
MGMGQSLHEWLHNGSGGIPGSEHEHDSGHERAGTVGDRAVRELSELDELAGDQWLRQGGVSLFQK